MTSRYSYLILFTILAANQLVFGQNQELEACDSSKISMATTQAPEPPLGFDHLYRDINSELKLSTSVNGIVEVKFVVNCRGEIGNFEIIRGIDSITDESIIKALSLIQNWKPGKSMDEEIDCVFHLPFTIEEGALNK